MVKMNEQKEKTFTTGNINHSIKLINQVSGTEVMPLVKRVRAPRVKTPKEVKPKVVKTPE